MHAQTRLVRRQSTYYFRARIPRDLQPYLGKTEEKFSLKTKDHREALGLARQASVDFDARCASLRKEIERRHGGKKPLVIDDALINEVCALWRHQALAGDEHQRREGSFRDEWQDQKDERRQTAQALRETLAQSRLDAVQPALEAFLHLLGIDLRGSESRYRELLYRFLQTVAEVHNQQLKRDEGEVVWTPAPPEGSRLDTHPQGRVTFEELFDDWHRFDPSRPQRTVDDVRRTLDDLLSVIGQKAADAVERTDVIRYRDELIGRGLAPKTVGKKITFLCALLNTGINGGKLDKNPAQRIPIPKDDGYERLTFDTDDLRKIFGSPVFTERQNIGRGIRDAGRWIPVLALYQGCRVEELAQLLVSDVQHIDGIWCLSIDDMISVEGVRKRLKNKASRRRLPIHEKLIEAGFLRYVERIRGQGSERLFPDLRPDRFGKWSAGFSKAFMRLLRRDLGITDKRKVFHSFRHTFRDSCRDAYIDEEVADALMGHSNNQKVGRLYGSKFSVQRLHKEMQKIVYPGLEVPVLEEG